MKVKIIMSFLVFLTLLVIVATFSSDTKAVNQEISFSNLTLRVKPEKNTYLLGETINLHVELANETNVPISFHQCTINPNLGYLKIFIATSNGLFKEYRSPVQGAKDKLCGESSLTPAQIISSQMSILWNSELPTSHLNADAAKKVSEGKITTDYSIPLAGVYFVKTVLYFPNKPKLEIESQPIQIAVNEPVGDDLEVWNRIKDNGEFAYFIQQGELLTPKDEERKKLLKEIEQIAEKYPNSFLTGQMKRSLGKFRINEEKRKEMLEKARVKPKN